MENLRTATAEDFKIGNTLIASDGHSFTITSKYDKGIWNARGTDGQGSKCLFEDEAKFYKIAEYSTQETIFYNDCWAI